MLKITSILNFVLHQTARKDAFMKEENIVLVYRFEWRDARKISDIHIMTGTAYFQYVVY
jgi:hypothetical protein